MWMFDRRDESRNLTKKLNAPKGRGVKANTSSLSGEDLTKINRRAFFWMSANSRFLLGGAVSTCSVISFLEPARPPIILGEGGSWRQLPCRYTNSDLQGSAPQK